MSLLNAVVCLHLTRTVESKMGHDDVAMQLPANLKTTLPCCTISVFLPPKSGTGTDTGSGSGSGPHARALCWQTYPSSPETIAINVPWQNRAETSGPVLCLAHSRFAELFPNLNRPAFVSAKCFTYIDTRHHLTTIAVCTRRGVASLRSARVVVTRNLSHEQISSARARRVKKLFSRRSRGPYFWRQ